MAIYPFSISPFVILDITAVEPEPSPVIVSAALKGLFKSVGLLYVIVVPETVLTIALAPDVPPVIVSPTLKVVATEAVSVNDEFVTSCFI